MAILSWKNRRLSGPVSGQRVGKVVDIHPAAPWGAADDTVDLKELGLQGVHEVWFDRPAQVVVGDSGKSLTLGGSVAGNARIRLIGW